MVTLAERLEGGLWGLLVGDALGVPYEFAAPENLPPRDALEMEPPSTWRAPHDVPPGTWSDDGAQALCLLASLTHCGALDLDDLGRRFLDWYRHGSLAVDGHVFDVGVQTARALRALEAGTPAHLSGPADERSNGNGALMRVLPLALWHTGTDAALMEDAFRQCLPTHGHARSQVCCAVYCLWARGLLQGDADALPRAVTAVRAHGALRPAHAAEVARVEEALASMPPRGTGYVLDTLVSAAAVMRAHPDVEQALKGAIALGHDTDTTACVVGGLAGIRGGVAAIPARWREAMRGQDLVTPLVEVLLRHRGAAR